MLNMCNCYKRKCKHYLGIIQSDNTEKTEVNYCKAFLKGMPDAISYGKNKHLKKYSGQENEIVYEKINDTDK